MAALSSHSSLYLTSLSVILQRSYLACSKGLLCYCVAVLLCRCAAVLPRPPRPPTTLPGRLHNTAWFQIERKRFASFGDSYLYARLSMIPGGVVVSASAIPPHTRIRHPNVCRACSHAFLCISVVMRKEVSKAARLYLSGLAVGSVDRCEGMGLVTMIEDGLILPNPVPPFFMPCCRQAKHSGT